MTLKNRVKKIHSLTVSSKSSYDLVITILDIFLTDLKIYVYVKYAHECI